MPPSKWNHVRVIGLVALSVYASLVCWTSYRHIDHVVPRLDAAAVRTDSHLELIQRSMHTSMTGAAPYRKAPTEDAVLLPLGADNKAISPVEAVKADSAVEAAKASSPEAASASGSCAPMQVRLVSAGKDDGNMADFYLNGKLLTDQLPSGRGLNLVAMEPRTWKVHWKRNYDVWEDWDLANEKVFDDMEALPQGTVILVGAMDSGMEKVDTYTIDALQKYGANMTGGKFRHGYALIGTKGGKALAEKMGPSVEVTAELPCELAPASVKTGEEAVKSDQVLFSIVSDSKFYNTRVKWIMDTWGQDVPKDALMVVADKKTTDNVPVRLEETDCQVGSHEAGCCKYGHAVFAAAQRLNDVQDFQWFYFADDDVYVRPDAIKTQLAKRRITNWPLAKGLLGCGNEKCQGAVCGGGGFLLNKMGLQKIVGNETREQFVKTYMDHCAYCDNWGDLAVSKLIKDRGLKLENMRGLHPWQLNYNQFNQELAKERPPLTLHYQKNPGQFQMLYRLFSKSPKADAARAEADQNALFARAETAIAGFKEEDAPSRVEWNAGQPQCSEFEGRKSCAKGGLEAPWGI